MKVLKAVRKVKRWKQKTWVEANQVLEVQRKLDDCEKCVEDRDKTLKIQKEEVQRTLDDCEKYVEDRDKTLKIQKEEVQRKLKERKKYVEDREETLKIQKKVFGQKGGEFEEKTESTGGNMKDCCKGGKDKKEGRGGEGEGLL